MITILEDEISDKNWNSRILETGLGTIYQTKERADYVIKAGVPVKFLKFIDNSGKIVAQNLLTFQPRFHVNNNKSKFLKNLPLLKKTVCNWSFGPIFFQPELYNDIYKTFFHYLKTHKYVLNGWTHPLLQHNIENVSKQYKIKKWGTYVLNLNQELDDLYKNIDKHSGRKNIERSEKRGVTIEQITENTLLDYLELINTTRRQNMPPADIDFFKFRWKTFQPLGYSGFLAKRDGMSVGGLLFSYFNGYIIEIGVARSKIDTEEKLYSQDLIKWKIIEWGVKNKMKYYDLSGFNPNPISQKEVGIEKYKRKWGGTLHLYDRILEKPNLFTNRDGNE